MTTTVGLREELKKKIKKFLTTKKGRKYGSIQRFVEFAVIEKLEELENKK